MMPNLRAQMSYLLGLTSEEMDPEVQESALDGLRWKSHETPKE